MNKVLAQMKSNYFLDGSGSLNIFINIKEKVLPLVLIR